MKLSKYPSIEQFRNVIYNIKQQAQYVGKDDEDNVIVNTNARLPTLTFNGTPKIHGTNSAICFDITPSDVEYWTQSRERIITPQDDNAGFSAYVYKNKEFYLELISKIREYLLYNYYHVDYDSCYIYGEWFGKSIQKGVGVSNCEKSFAVFNIKLSAKNQDENSNIYLDKEEVKTLIPITLEHNLFHVWEFGEYDITIDFNAPELIQNKLIELTDQVERECPVAKYFGFSNTVGEGIVWTYSHDNITHRFKVKGSEHSSSKVKTLASVDIEKVNSINECVENVVTLNRLNQGIEFLKSNNIELDVKNTGAFIKWINNDIAKEELDTILGNNLNLKDVLGQASKKSKIWFFDRIFGE